MPKPTSLSQEALAVVSHYEHLHIGGKQVRTPYMNNKRQQVRAALRVNIGKGTPTEIEDEVTILAARERLDLHIATPEQITMFLVQHHLGIECSGFAFHVLNAATKQALAKHMRFPKASPLRKLIQRLRPAENTNVRVLADDKNSSPIPLDEVQAGDMIIMIGTGYTHDLDHVLVVTQTDTDLITYAHALQWNTDGKYNHGIKHGTIRLTHGDRPLSDQLWEEANHTDDKNETAWRARTAERLEIRRLHIAGPA